MSADDGYGGFASHYDLHGWDWFAPACGERLVELLRERHVGPRILDAGCGTGTLALMLADHAFEVVGCDLSPGMIEVAREKDAAGQVEWHRGDIVDFRPPGGAFDGVVCVADILNHLEALDEWEAAFRNFAVCLKPGGLLFFDVVTRAGLKAMERQSAAEHDGRMLISSCIYEPARARSTLKVISFVPAGDGLYRRAAEAVTEYGQPVAAILDRLARAGFDGIERPWRQADDAEAEDRLVVLARRR